MKKLLCIIILLLILPGCFDQSNAQVAATTLPVYEFTSRLCQNTPLAVEQIVTESVSCLHDYSLQIAQMRTIESADVVILSGAGLEEFLEDALLSANSIIDSSQSLSLIDTDQHDHDNGHIHGKDPHIWLSPENAKIMAHNICIGLKQQYPAFTDIFESNLLSLLSDLDDLQAYGEAQLGTLSCRELITFHDGFAYLAESFDLKILAAVEEESGSEASASSLIELIGIVQSHGLPAVFTETNGSTASAQIIAAETGVRIFSLDMAIAGSSYFDSMCRNIDTLREALQ